MIVTFRETKYGIRVFSYLYVFHLNKSSKATFFHKEISWTLSETWRKKKKRKSEF